MTTSVPQSPDNGDHSPATLFNVEGSNIRFGTTDDDVIYAIASDFAQAIGYRDAANALRILDADEAGTQIVSTRSVTGVIQRREVSVIYEDGMWELIFRSSLPGAKKIKKRVKAILREIRQTGRYEIDADARLWRVLASEGDDYSAREAAGILNRDHSIITGQTLCTPICVRSRCLTPRIGSMPRTSSISYGVQARSTSTDTENSVSEVLRCASPCLVLRTCASV